MPATSSSARLFTLALALSAGAITPLTFAGENARSLEVRSARGGSELVLAGSPVHRAPGGARIVNQRLITFADSPTVLAVWDEVSRHSTRGHFAISVDGTTTTQVMPAGREVRLRYARFDPLAAAPAVPAELRAGPENELFLVQFLATPFEDIQREIVALGGEIERFLTENTLVVRMTPQVRANVEARPYTRWVGAYEPAYRLCDAVIADVLGMARSNEPVRYSIEVMRRGMEQQQAIADFVRGMGGLVEVFTPDQFRMEVTVTPAQLLEIARRNEVNFIDHWGGPVGEDMDLMRQVGGAVPLLSNAGFLGQGVRGHVFDSGLITNHQEWGQTPLVLGTIASASHGTACYGINFAIGFSPQATGMMPQREQGIFTLASGTTQFGGTVMTRLSNNTQATNPSGPYRSVFQTSSVGSARVTNYTTISAEVDDYLWQVDYLSCQSQSNASGTRDSRPQAWAKNIVSVGGINHNESLNFNSHVWATGASVGPAPDLRVKPDLAHSFSGVWTTSTTSPTGYGNFSGTSSATPITCGHFGLLHQMWHEGVWAGFGGASSVFLSRPRSTTAKALMINTAHRYPVTQGNMVRARVGWGAAHLGNMYNLRNKTFIINETQLLTNAQSAVYQLEVAPGESEFKATMAFIDPAGNPAALEARRNDLSLRVTSPLGVTYWGNNGMIATAISGTGQSAGANFTVPGGSPNTVDTVENVFVQNPAPGIWTVEVIASQIVVDAVPSTPAMDASFALVVTGVTEVQAPCYANCDGSTVEPILNVQDFSCFINEYALAQQLPLAQQIPSYANCDGSTVEPILNIQDFTCFINQFALGCP
jgi:serine protease AprX